MSGIQARQHIVRQCNCGLWASVALLAAMHAFAQDSDVVERARQALERATAAQASGHFAEAARQFSLADRLVPNELTLQASLDAAVAADDPVLGMELLDRCVGRASSTALHQSVQTARDKFSSRVGRLRVPCPSSERCTVRVDGAPVPSDTVHWTLAGSRLIEVTTGTHRLQQHVTIQAGPQEQVVALTISAAAEPITTLAPNPFMRVPAGPAGMDRGADGASPSGISPTWFWVSAGLSTALTGSFVASSIDASNKHEEFVSAGCTRRGSASCDDLASQRQSAQTRTNVLAGLSAASIMTTAGIGLFWVRWHDTHTTVACSPGPSASAPTVTVTTRF